MRTGTMLTWRTSGTVTKEAPHPHLQYQGMTKPPADKDGGRGDRAGGSGTGDGPRPVQVVFLLRPRGLVNKQDAVGGMRQAVVMLNSIQGGRGTFAERDPGSNGPWISASNNPFSKERAGSTPVPNLSILSLAGKKPSSSQTTHRSPLAHRLPPHWPTLAGQARQTNDVYYKT